MSRLYVGIQEDNKKFNVTEQPCHRLSKSYFWILYSRNILQKFIRISISPNDYMETLARDILV
jgi:hypothetical protein